MQVFFVLMMALSIVSSDLTGSSMSFELQKMKQRVDIVYTMLESEGCPVPSRGRRDLLSSASDSLEYEIESRLYQQLFDLLTACRANNTTATGTSTSTTTKRVTTTTTTTGTPTTQTTVATPAVCFKALNLTESWRLDHKQSGIRPANNNYNCDTKSMIAAGRPWFRFTGGAGNKLADTCIPYYSCGASGVLWSNDTMPSKVGVISSFSVYANAGNSCSDFTWRASVMRCSGSAHDFIYRYDDAKDNCNYGFCGMKA